MELDNVLNMLISHQPNAYTPIDKVVTINDILKQIKHESLADRISSLRGYLENGEIERYNIYKRNLPAVTFSGTFHGKRRRENLNSYNSIIVLDIDKLDAEQISCVRHCLLNDPFVLSFWESPSKTGFKGLVAVKYSQVIPSGAVDKFHKAAFEQLGTYFTDKYKITLDDSGSDTTRLCFLSSDAGLVLKETSNPFIVEQLEFSDEEVKRHTATQRKDASDINTLMNPKGKNDPKNRRKIQSIIRYLSRKNISITSSYEEWYRVAYAIANTFTYDIGRKYYLAICRLDGANHDELSCQNMLQYCYENNEGNINFNSIVYYAKQKGYTIKEGEGTEDVHRKYQPE